MSYRRERDTIEADLKYWDGSTEYFTDAPTRTRIDDDGNFEAVWVTMTKPKTWVKGEEDEDGDYEDGDYEEDEGADEVIGWLERVVIKPDSFLVERYEDVIEYYSDDPHVDEEGSPYYERHGEEYTVESVEFDRRQTLRFLIEFLSGKLKRDTRQYKVPSVFGRPPGFWTEHFWTSIPSTPAARRRPPRNKLELLPWLRSMGYSIISSGGGHDYVYEVPEYDW